MDKREGEIVEDDYQWETGTRRYKVYSVMESELEMLVHSPWFIRRRIAKRLREETIFDDPAPPRKDIARETD